MNILVVAPTPFFSHRGTHIRIFEQVKQVLRLGNKVTIATYHIGEDPDFGDLKSQVVIKRIHRLLFWYKKKSAGPNWQKIFLDILLVNKIFWLVVKNDYDVIHAHLHEGVIISSVVTKLVFWKNIKILGDFHGDLVGEMVQHGYLQNFFIRKVFKIIESWIYRLPHRIITSSRTLADSIALKAPHQIIGALPDGEEIISQNKGGLGSKKIKRDLGIPEHASLVVYTGGFTADKGIQHLLRALEHPSLQSMKDVYICLAGSPYGVIARAIEQHVMTNRIVVLDHFKTHRLDDLFVLADVVVDPKDAGGFQSSGKLIRYIMAGLPIVCFNTEVNRTYLGEGYPFASLEEFGSLAQKIVQVISDPIFSQQATDWVVSRQKFFRSDTLAQALVNEYVQLCIK
jgi:glycosyltransferase involved in cell wall biosynthesis